ncbi:hypothetical protein [Agromyces larvae]|uniref:Uncharacterized protein n=1 Tax=Agromyces larvae TaxID=2929802 RepID=A0ABY4C3Q1_9MICO|nr:hypothetical protein [Agromyces larvae]UOE45949.1 hypothetical protein MTO99_09470 [Agromyces larvae]
MEFRLTIKLGNAAMLTPADIAEQLERVAADLQNGIAAGDAYAPADLAGPFGIYNQNGNRVGAWEVTE